MKLIPQFSAFLQPNRKFGSPLKNLLAASNAGYYTMEVFLCSTTTICSCPLRFVICTSSSLLLPWVQS